MQQAVPGLLPLRTCNQAISACRRNEDWQKALHLLFSATLQQLQPSVISYGSAIAACGPWHVAEFLLRDLQTFNNANLIVYSASINACGKAAFWRQATCFFNEVQRKSLEPNTVTSSAAISACEKAMENAGEVWPYALQLLQLMNMDVVSCNAVLSAAKPWTVAMALLRDLQRSQLRPSAVTCSASVASLVKDQWVKAIHLLVDYGNAQVEINVIGYGAAQSTCQDWRWAVQLFQKIRATNQLPTVISYNALISSCEAKKALELLAECTGVQLQPDIVTFNAAISACEKSNLWQEAIASINSAQQRRLQCDVITFNAVISACGKCQKLQKAMGFLDMMELQQIEPTVVTFNSVISAASWPFAMMLLTMMEEKTLQADLITCNAAIGCCEKDSCWQGALQLLRQLAASGSADLISYNTAIAAARNNWILALTLFSEAYLGRLELDVITYNTSIRACQAFGRWRAAVELLAGAEYSDTMNLVTCSEVISSCERGFAPLETVILLNEMERLCIAHQEKVTE